MRARRSIHLLGALVAAHLLVACGGGSGAPASAPSTTRATTSSTASTTSQPPATTTRPEPSPRVLRPSDVGEGWDADAYDPAEVGSPCGSRNTDAILVPTAKVGMVAVAQAKDGRVQEDLRSYQDAGTADRAYDSLLSEVDCPKGSAPDGRGGTVELTIGPTVPLTTLGSQVQRASTKQISATGFTGRSLIALVGDEVLILQVVQPDGASTPMPPIEALARSAIERLGT